jgi:DNA recombination protein RmuC
MEPSAYLLIFLLVGGAGGFLGAWGLLRALITNLRGQVAAAQEASQAPTQKLERALQDTEAWRERLQVEQLERAKFEAQAQRAEGLETELSQIRARAEGLAAQRSTFQAAAERVPHLESRLGELADEIAELKASNAQLQTQLYEQAQAHLEKIEMLAQLRGEIEKDLKNITADALRSNQGAFLQLANEVFEKHKTGAGVELDTRKKEVEALITPLRESLQAYRQEVGEMEKARTHSYGVLSAELKGVVTAQNAVRTETSKLVNALRSAPKTRGRWGEQTLRNVLELSQLSAYCDFSREESFVRDGAAIRPDVVIRLPGGRTLVVDAKTSLSAYLDAVDATDDGERDRHLALHAAQIRNHAKQLSAKTYWDALPVNPDFVVMFVPGDNFYAAAAERDPALFEDAAADGVIIVTPATLIALAKAVAFGWRQEKVAENAQRVHALGRELYRRMITMTAHIERCGDSLGKSVKHFNQFIGSLEHSVMPQVRRFNELEVEGTGTEISLLEPVELEPRLLRSGRDFVEEGSGSAEAA